MTTAEIQRHLDDLLEEEALVLGGLVELHDVPDAFVDQMFRNLAVLREHALERIGWVPEPGRQSSGEEGRRRPAIEQFLAQLHRSDPSTDRGRS